MPLRKRPGPYLWLGQGRATPGAGGQRPLHHRGDDFNDDALPHGWRWFCVVADGRWLCNRFDPQPTNVTMLHQTAAGISAARLAVLLEPRRPHLSAPR